MRAKQVQGLQTLLRAMEKRREEKPSKKQARRRRAPMRPSGYLEPEVTETGKRRKGKRACLKSKGTQMEAGPFLSSFYLFFFFLWREGGEMVRMKFEPRPHTGWDLAGAAVGIGARFSRGLVSGLRHTWAGLAGQGRADEQKERILVGSQARHWPEQPKAEVEELELSC